MSSKPHSHSYHLPQLLNSSTAGPSSTCTVFSAPEGASVRVVMRMCDSAAFTSAWKGHPTAFLYPLLIRSHPCPWLARLPFFSNLSFLVLLLVISLKTYRRPKDNSRHLTGAGTTVFLLLQLTRPLSLPQSCLWLMSWAQWLLLSSSLPL